MTFYASRAAPGPWLLLTMLVAPQAHAQASLADVVSGCGGAAPQNTIQADASSYQAALATLAPGDRLLLAAGTYANGLSIGNLHGAPAQCIVIEGPSSGPPAVFTGRNCCNTVSIRDSSYVIIRNLELDGSGGIGDAVKAEFDSTSSHHLVLENLYIHDHDADQQIVGINTKSDVWNWVIRKNVIDGAGTGIYLGNSNGEGEFVNGLIEHNLIRRTLGYNMQIKHQNGRATALGAPATGTTIIRHNVFSKAQGSSTGALARPNLLVGHWPLSGDGADDVYQIYGNLLYQNPVEALFQGEGNIAFHDNLLVNHFAPSGFPVVAIQPHNDVPRAVELFHNTVVAAGTGVVVTGGNPSFEQNVRANAVFSPAPISASSASDNVTDAYAAASNYLGNPTAPLGAGLDLYPLPGVLSGPVVESSDFAGFLDFDRDFNGEWRDGTFRGAYAGEGGNPGWTLALERKPDVEPLPADLAITKNNNQLTSVPGATTTFTIDVTNHGPGDVSQAVVTDDFDPLVYDIANVSFTCVVGAGAGPGTGCPANGVGAELVAGVHVDVEASDTVSLSVDAPVLATASGLLVNTANVAPPMGVSDPATANNTASDIDGIPGACGHPADLDLSNLVIDYVENFTACNSIGAGAGTEVDSDGELTLRAGTVIAIRNGFSAQPGARFTVELDQTLASP